MEGIINVLKPPGMTSSDVVVRMRKVLKIKKIGHTGTLDPGVAGVLPLCVGKGTRLAEYITEQGKAYLAEVTFGITTDTQDAFGKVTQLVSAELRQNDLERVLSSFMGKIEQTPPMYSAVRKEGKHLYEYARQGIAIERTPREVSIYKLKLDKWYEEEFPRAILNIECSKGTYIRTLCHDLGQALGCGAHMSNLLRVRSGPFMIQNSWTLEEIEASAGESTYSFLLPLTAGIDLPRVFLSAVRANAFRHGLPTKRELVKTSPTDTEGNSPFVDRGSSFEAESGIRTTNHQPRTTSESYVQVIEDGELIGIGHWSEDSLFPHKVFV
ncbi:tRNA pseudouridine synthase B [Candidatus Desulfosporosinus infrequens]|uniref:tRNA pseudouridine synthase B n=1 Tax=Candidatus Desulfosporosinus infrequens TaxID=2043169 RepID=A0A2U3LTQ5_9FIRM|nr:tRNA pseudouridine synthase B [Candidatus Desulfosporosinus infrequens]